MGRFIRLPTFKVSVPMVVSADGSILRWALNLFWFRSPRLVFCSLYLSVFWASHVGGRLGTVASILIRLFLFPIEVRFCPLRIQPRLINLILRPARRVR